MSLVVSGFVRAIEESLPNKQQILYQIPDAIFQLVIYFVYGQAIFNQQDYMHGDNLLFIDDNTVRKIDEDWPYSISTFGSAITDEQCNQIELQIKWKNVVYGFFMGFVVSGYMEPKIANYNAKLGDAENKNNSIGIFILKSSENFYLYNQRYLSEKLYPVINAEFKENDLFILSFNFTEHKIYIRYDDKMVEVETTHTIKQIIPAFALCEIDEEIEVMHCVYSWQISCRLVECRLFWGWRTIAAIDQTDHYVVF